MSHDRGVWTVEALVGGTWHSTHEALGALRGAPHDQRALSHDERCRVTVDVLAVFDGAREQVQAIERHAAERRALLSGKSGVAR